VPERPIAQRAAFISAVIGPVIGALFLFAPIHGSCISTITGPGPQVGSTPDPATVGPTTCFVEALWQRQQLFPMPFFAVLIWSLAPVVVFYGILLRLRGSRSRGTALVIAGLLLECTVLISFGAAPMFVPTVLLPLAITTTIALRRS
jgi:hypothetical protein